MIRLNIDYREYAAWHRFYRRRPGQPYFKEPPIDRDTYKAYEYLDKVARLLDWGHPEQADISHIRDNYESNLHPALFTSIQRIGQTTPIILCDYLLIDGHERLEVAKQLNWTTISAIHLPPDTESSAFIGLRFILNGNHSD